MTPLETVRTFLKAMEVKDYDTALPLLAEDCDYQNMPIGKAKGREGARAALEPFFAPTVENELIILKESVAGDFVVTERLDRHRLPDRWVELPVCGLWEIHDGRIAAWREYFDLQTLFRQWPELKG